MFETTFSKAPFNEISFSAMHWVISPEPVSPRLDVPCGEDLLLSEAYLTATDKVNWLKANLALSQEQIEQVSQNEE